MAALAHPASLADFEVLMAEAAPRLVVVDFFAEWCGPCKMAAPRFLALAERHKELARFAKVDVDNAQDLAAFAKIRAMPTFQIYKDGECVCTITGLDLGKLESQLLSWGADVASRLEAAAAAAAPPPSAVPHTTLLRFEDGDASKVLRKLEEFAAAELGPAHEEELSAALVVERSHSSSDPTLVQTGAGCSNCTLYAPLRVVGSDSALSLRVLVDVSVVEAYAMHGRAHIAT